MVSSKTMEDLDEEMCSLSQSLGTLLANVPHLPRTPSSTSVLVDSVTEDTVKQFRSRVARRIYRSNALLREMARLLEELPDGSRDRRRCQEAYEAHAERLEEHKTMASQWWRHIERQFHRLRMAALLAKESGGGGGGNMSLRDDPLNHVTASQKVDAALVGLKEDMIAEADRMRIAGEELGLEPFPATAHLPVSSLQNSHQRNCNKRGASLTRSGAI